MKRTLLLITTCLLSLGLFAAELSSEYKAGLECGQAIANLKSQFDKDSELDLKSSFNQQQIQIAKSAISKAKSSGSKEYTEFLKGVANTDIIDEVKAQQIIEVLKKVKFSDLKANSKKFNDSHIALSDLLKSW